MKIAPIVGRGLLPFLATLICLPSSGLGADYPSKPIRLIAGYPAGAASDTLARILAERLAQRTGHNVIVDNRPGAAGDVAAELAANSAPDGHTLLLVSTSYGIRPSLTQRLRYDVIKDFTAVSPIASAPLILVVNTSLPVQSVPDLIKHARAKPGQLSYASSGTGTSLHLGMELLKIYGGVNIVHVPYKGVPQALVEVMSGQVQMIFSTTSPAIPLIKAGKLRALAVSSAKRSPAAPDVPPISDTFPGFVSDLWWGVAAPSGTQTKVVNILNEAITGVVSAPDIADRLRDLGFSAFTSSPKEFGAFIKAEMVKWAKVAKASGVRLD